MKVFSLPSIGDGVDGRPARRHVELGVKGPEDVIEAAFVELQRGVQRLGAPYRLDPDASSPPSGT